MKNYNARNNLTKFRLDNDFKTALKNVSCIIVDRGFRLEKVFDEFGVKVKT